MDARLAHAVVLTAAFLSLGAGYRTENFIVDAPTKELAEEIGRNAERYRRELALQWLGEVMPTWGEPCMLTAEVDSNLGAGGATSFVFDRGEVFGWRMEIQGSRERILDSVLPHEVTHTVFATHFRQPLPRWADEGACTTVEHASERMKQQQMLITFLKTGRGISFSQMFAMKEYPADVMPLYSQGYSLARFLIEQHGRQAYMEFLSQGLEDERWEKALKQQYGIDNLLVLQNTWLAWVKKGSPRLELQSAGQTVLVSNETTKSDATAIYRGQSPDETDVDVPAKLVPVGKVRPISDNVSAYAKAGGTVSAGQEAPSRGLATQASDDHKWHPAGTRGLREQQPLAVEAATKQADRAALIISQPFSSQLNGRQPRMAIRDYQLVPGTSLKREPLRDSSSGSETFWR